MLFGVTEGIIVQQVNCQNDMDAGRAKAIYDQYPQVKEDYTKSFETKTGVELFGTYRIIDISDKLKVANLYTQYDRAIRAKPETLGKVYTDVDQLVGTIQQLHKNFPDDTIYVPKKIGCGLGGGKWEDVITRLEQLHCDKIVIIDTMQQVISSVEDATFLAMMDMVLNKFSGVTETKYFKIINKSENASDLSFNYYMISLDQSIKINIVGSVAEKTAQMSWNIKDLSQNKGNFTNLSFYRMTINRISDEMYDCRVPKEILADFMDFMYE